MQLSAKVYLNSWASGGFFPGRWWPLADFSTGNHKDFSRGGQK